MTIAICPPIESMTRGRFDERLRRADQELRHSRIEMTYRIFGCKPYMR